jgi:hypothetical protein
MIRFLIRAAIFLVTAALGLWIASLILPGFVLTWEGFFISIVVFALAQSLLAPFIFNVARKYASPLLGGIGLVSTFVALLIATLFTGGLQITGAVAWIVGTLIVWLVTALGGWLLPVIFLKEKINGSDRRTA